MFQSVSYHLWNTSPRLLFHRTKVISINFNQGRSTISANPSLHPNPGSPRRPPEFWEKSPSSRSLTTCCQAHNGLSTMLEQFSNCVSQKRMFWKKKIQSLCHSPAIPCLIAISQLAMPSVCFSLGVLPSMIQDITPILPHFVILIWILDESQIYWRTPSAEAPSFTWRSWHYSKTQRKARSWLGGLQK